jgi:hypothetical protein
VRSHQRDHRVRCRRCLTARFCEKASTACGGVVYSSPRSSRKEPDWVAVGEPLAAKQIEITFILQEAGTRPAAAENTKQRSALSKGQTRHQRGATPIRNDHDEGRYDARR